MPLQGFLCTGCLKSAQVPLYCEPQPKKNSRLLSEKSNKNKINNNNNNKNNNNNNKNNNKVTPRTALLAVKKDKRETLKRKIYIRYLEV